MKRVGSLHASSHIQKMLGHVWFLFSKTKTIFENTDNNVLVFSKNCYFYLNLVLSIFLVTTKQEPN